MTAIIHPEQYDTWLDASVTDVNVLQALLGPYPERLMEAYPISKLVNAPAHDSPEVIRPVEVSQ